MTKLMRKYQKWLLAVFGSVLMVIFLVQGTVSSMRNDPGDRVYAVVNGKKVTANERGVADARFAILNRNFPGLLDMFGITDEERWFLLSYEARHGGFCGYAGDGRDFMEELAQTLAVQALRQRMQGMPFEEQFKIMQDRSLQQQIMQPDVDVLLLRMRNTGAPEDRAGMNTILGFERTLADLRGVLRMLTVDMTASRLSDRGVREALSEQQSQVIVDAIVLDAERLIPSMPPPTTEELAAQFEKARSIDPAKAADGVGYVMPPRVKVQWISVDKAALGKAVALDDVAVNKHWRQNRKTYPGEFDVEKPKIEAAMIEEQASRLMTEVDRAIKTQVTLAIKDLPESGGFRTLPEEWATARPSMANIAVKVVEAVKTATGVTIPTPTVDSRDTWLTADQLRMLPGIGGASLGLGTMRVPFSRLAFQVRELNPEKAVAALQVGIPFVASPVADSAGNHFTFMVDAAKDTAPAESLDEVREKVAHDVLAVKAFEKLAANLDVYKVLAVSDGLEAVGRLAVEGTSAAAPTPRQRLSIPREEGLRNDPDVGVKEVSDPIWAVGGMLDPLVEPAKDTLASRTVAVARPDARKVVVAQVLQYKPLTLEAVRRLSPSQLVNLRQRELTSLYEKGPVPSAYSIESLKARLKYEVADQDAKNKKK